MANGLQIWKNRRFFIKSYQNGEKNLGQKHSMIMNTMFRFKYRNEKFTIYAEEEHPGDHTFCHIILKKEPTM